MKPHGMFGNLTGSLDCVKFWMQERNLARGEVREKNQKEQSQGSSTEEFGLDSSGSG